MIRLLIIADDFTGALDTGVKFAEGGAVTKVVTAAEPDFTRGQEDMPEVLVVDAETRHLSPEEAYRRVWNIVDRAKKQGVECVFKKTDSALRGNIGSELTAALDASGERALHFFPAFPGMNRITKNGIHYIDGVPVHESVFGKDPFEPVTSSNVKSIIGDQSEVPVLHAGASDIPPDPEEPSILLYDVSEDEELKTAGKQLRKEGRLKVIAGCAGLGGVLPEIMDLGGTAPEPPQLERNFLVMCGSVNPVTRKQLEYAQRNGFARIRLTPQQKLQADYLKSPLGEAGIQSWIQVLKHAGCCVIDTNDMEGSAETMEYAKKQRITKDDVRETIAANLGYILARFLDCRVDCTMMITGGDSLLGFMEQIGVKEIMPVCELEPGIVLSRFSLKGQPYEIITKSGGFGGERLLVDLADRIAPGKLKKEDDIYAVHL